MKRFLLGIIVTAALGVTAQAQKVVDTWSFSTGMDTAAWMDISGADSTIIDGNNTTTGFSTVCNIGFPFTLGATTHTQFSTNTNGTVRLGSGIASPGYYSQPLGSNIAGGPKVEPLGGRGRFDDSCYTRMALLGDSGSRVLVVETRLMEYNNGLYPGYYSFQVQLFETGGLRIVYGESDSTGNPGFSQNGVSATQGNTSDKDVVFIDFATNTESRFDVACTLTNAIASWPERGRWYMLAPDSNACPYPPSVTTTNQDPTGIWLQNSYGGLADLRVVIPEVGIDTIWPMTDSYFFLGGGFAPNTTYYGTVQSVCDSGRVSYRTRQFQFTTDCGPVTRLPWIEDFGASTSTACWDLSQYTAYNKKWGRVSSAGAMRSGSAGSSLYAYNEHMVSPVFLLPDSDGIVLSWDYKSELKSGVAPQVEVRLVPCAVDGTVGSGVWTTLLTLNDYVADYTRQHVSLDTWRGEYVKVDFVLTGTNGRYAWVDNVTLSLEQSPLAELQAPVVAHVGDSVNYVATMVVGVDSGVVYSWHSSLLNQTSTDVGGWTVVYTETGIDTITLVITNVYGADTVTAVVYVVDCSTVTALPWEDGFAHTDDCWEISGWQKTASYNFYDEEDVYRQFQNVMYASNTGAYMLTQPISLPATGMHNMKLWVECASPLTVRLSPTADTAISSFTDTLFTDMHSRSQAELWWQVADLEPYAGQTVRIGLFKEAGLQAFVNRVKIDYDTLPVLWQVVVPSLGSTDSTTVCSAALRRGSTDSLTVTWHSTLLDSTWVVNGDYTIGIDYPFGGIDTVTVVAANAYGADTVTKTVRVSDCNPATSLPWMEDFSDEALCWYKPQGSNWYTTTWSGNRYLYLNVLNDTLSNWIISKEIVLPADTNLLPHLFWRPSWLLTLDIGVYDHLRYSVMITTDNDYTDTTHYTVLYTDNLRRSRFDFDDLLSASLADYAGQHIHIAFRSYPHHLIRTVSVHDQYINIDDVLIRTTEVPVVSVAADANRYYYGDTATFTATLREGSSAGISYTWHSTLLDSTITTPTGTLYLTYGLHDGRDTVSVIATNLFGSDTGWVVVNSQMITIPSITGFTAEDIAFLPNQDEADLGDTVVYLLTRNKCITTGFTYSLHSSLLDTTVTVATTAETCSIPLVYTVAGTDSLTATVANIYDSSSDPATLQLTVSNCLSVGVPFFEDFENMGDSWDYIPCWTGWWTLMGLSDSNYVARSPNNGVHELLITPAINLPADTPYLQLSWFTYMPGSSPSASIGILVSPSGGKQVGDFTDTLFVGDVANLSYDSLSLDAYLGQRIRIAFYSPVIIYIDDVRVDYDRSAPQIAVTAPDSAYTYDSLLFIASLAAGAPQSLTYSWNSSIGTITGTGDSVILFYTASGTDTLTVVATTAYGSDTVILMVDVVNHPLPQVAISGSSMAEIGDTLTFSAILNNCSQYGLGMNWHSSLTGNSGSGHLFQQVYTIAGNDTITLMASNNFGADTAVAVIRVLNCNMTPLPYYEDFESVTAVTSSTEGFLPDCWSRSWNGSNSAYAPHVVSTGGYQYISNIPNNALLLLTGGSTGYGNLAEVVLPGFTDSLQHLSIAFDYWSESSGTLTVGYLHEDVFHTITTIPNHAGSYLRDTVNFASATDSDGRIALRWSHATSWWGVAIDNVEVFSDGSSNPPTSVTVDSVGIATAHVWWDSVFNASAYHVVVDSLIDTVVTGLSCRLDNLMPHTTYTVRVAGIVDGDTGRYASANFTTLCGIRLPYYNDFGQGNNSIDCWTNYRTSMEIYSQQLSISKDVYSECHMATSVVDAPGNGLFGWFKVKRRVSAREVGLIVGAMTDPTSPSTFIPIDTFTVTSSWTECQFNTRGLGSTPLAIAFRPYNSYDGLLIDDLHIESATPCAQLFSVDATVLSATSAELSWEYDTESDLPILGVLVTLYDTTSGDTTVFIAHGTDTTLGGLPLRHTFRADISTFCGSDTSEPLSVTFTPEPMPCAEVQGDNIYMTSHPIQNTDDYAYSQMLYPAVLAASVDTLYGIAFRFTGVNDGDTRLIDVYIGQTTATTLTSPVSATSLTPAVQNHVFSNVHGWVKIPFSTPVPLDGVSNLIVTIDDNTGHMGYNTMSFGAHLADTGGFLYYDGWPNTNVNPYTLGFAVSGSSAIPDIQLLGHCATDRCQQPAVGIEPDTNSLHVAWSQRGSESYWRVEYHGEGDSTWIRFDSVANTSFTVTGLNASSRYWVRVGSLCSDSSVINCDEVVVSTLCGAVDVPFYQNFMMDSMPCWVVRNYPNVSYGLDLYHNLPAVSPAVGGNLAQMQVRFKITGSPNFHPVVKVGIGNANGTNATWIDSMMLSSLAVEEHVVSLGGYTGSDNHLLLVADQPYARILELTIEPVVCHAVHHVVVSQLTDSSALLSWPPVSNDHQWAVYLDDSLLTVTTTPSYTLQGLLPSTEYAFAVREICGTGDTSEATTATFTTLCPALPLPWSEDFEAYTTSSAPIPCWSYNIRPLNIAVASTIAYVGYYNASHTLRIYDVTHSNPIDTNRTNFICTPMLYNGGNPFTIEFDAYLLNGHVTVGVMTDVTDTNTFIPLEQIGSTTVHYSLTTDTLATHSLFSVAFTCHGTVNCYIDNISVHERQIPTYQVNLAVNDSTMGSVVGAGSYEEGTVITISAIPNEGYHFVQWSDSITEAQRQITVQGDITLTAFFAADTVWHTVTVSANVEGIVETYGSGLYPHGDTVEVGFHLLDTVAEGGHWQFIGWDDNGQTDTNRDNPRMVVVLSDTLFTALFGWVRDSVEAIDEVYPISPSVTIFPNPATGTATIRCEQSCTIVFLTADGREAMRLDCQPGDRATDLNILTQGVYFLHILHSHQPPIKLIVLF